MGSDDMVITRALKGRLADTSVLSSLLFESSYEQLHFSADMD